MLEVSAGVIRRADGRILVCQRGEGRMNPHLWEFPGGKREAGETAAQCLVRELREELSLEVRDVKELYVNEAQGIRFTFLTAEALNEPIATEHEAIMFVHPREMLALHFCPADTEVACRLALSHPALTDLLWDLDGTLMDTYEGITATVLRACRHFNLEPDPAEVLTLLKNELAHCLRVMASRCGHTYEELRAAYDAEVPYVDFTAVRPLPGIRELLIKLSACGVRHWIVTHRDDDECRIMLESNGLAACFAGMVAGKAPLPRKPAPDRVLHILTTGGIAPEHAVMIGDRPLDMQAGKSAGILTILLDAEGRFPDAEADLHVPSAGTLASLLEPLAMM